MKLKIAAFILVFAAYSLSAVAAGPFTDEMSKCLVKNTNETDRTLLIRWIFAAMASHPDVKVLSNVSSEKGDELNKDAANLMVALLTKRCKSETQQALKYEGKNTIEVSFQILGQVAMQGLMTNPDVAKYIAGLASHMDKKALENAFGASK
ncbi:MAG: hypothetical protein HY081_11155 [Gammaproteobacteria bacterium]|nr:hypothetical protein [Gammaproteobacteria bacterium]